MSIAGDYFQLSRTLLAALPGVPLASLYLPPLRDDGVIRDEFGFVLLQDGSAGPFYVSLPGQLQSLWQRFPSPQWQGEVTGLLEGFLQPDDAARSLALGAFNALSQQLIRRSGLRLLPASGEKLPNIAAMQPEAGEWVGMVGYFAPVIEQLLARGARVMVLERQAQRVLQHADCVRVEQPEALRQCRHVLCTASTIVNDSLDELLLATAGVESFNIIGPSGSGLPDVLFARGVSSVGGVYFADGAALQARLQSQQSWRDCGNKFLLQAATYPGVASLLQRSPVSA